MRIINAALSTGLMINGLKSQALVESKYKEGKERAEESLCQVLNLHQDALQES